MNGGTVYYTRYGASLLGSLACICHIPRTAGGNAKRACPSRTNDGGKELTAIRAHTETPIVC